MFKINDNYLKLPGSYLFSTIGKKVAAFQEANPDKNIIRLGIGDVTQPLAPAIIEALHKSVDEMGKAETFRGYAPDLGYEFLRSTIAENDYKKRGADISADEILSVTELRVIRVTSETFSQLTIRLQYVTLYILYMLILMQWQAEQVIISLMSRDGAMLSTCHVQRQLTLHLSFLRKLLILSTSASLIILQVLQSIRQNFRDGLIMLTRLAQSSSTMQLMKHMSQSLMCLIRSMSARAQEHVQSSLEASLRMQALQDFVLDLQLFLRTLRAMVLCFTASGQEDMEPSSMALLILYSVQARLYIQRQAESRQQSRSLTI
ncbi:L,L-diaminopimelate aminotransferase [[Bacteroides] pectinophilus ATCC 43243]|uniref:LL-diaminopimelate aminotransferase n=1 Tax=[Bacteroides] pectinophilus ATCC 43243 TaxID=483218 RepID=B7ASB0_9FIRM|nr:L,L-diaminopimelate aminotransferase [[Bacteroides] pectinophilus ATCC 43243]